jgi:hypothetical protein
MEVDTAALLTLVHRLIREALAAVPQLPQVLVLRVKETPVEVGLVLANLVLPVPVVVVKVVLVMMHQVIPAVPAVLAHQMG